MRKYNELLLSPRCGDMWVFASGAYILVDYVDHFVGITFDSGMRVGFPTRNDFEHYVKMNEGVNLSRWEDGWFTHCADNGFSKGEPISKHESAAYIYNQIMTGGD